MQTTLKKLTLLNKILKMVIRLEAKQVIKNVIFDIGNVILYFNRDFLLGTYYQGEDYELIKEKLFHKWEEQDEGLITSQEYIKNVLASLPQKYHHVANTVLNYWEYSMRYTDGIISLIQELKEKGYKLYILSNMTDHFISRDYKFPILKEFDGIVYSAPIKMIKPNPKIFEYILNKYDLNPEECVFTDDTKPNLASAARFGIKTFHFQNNTAQLREFILSL